MSCYVCSALCCVSAYRDVLLCFALFLVFSVLLCPLFYRDIVVHFLSLCLPQACSQMQARDLAGFGKAGFGRILQDLVRFCRIG